MIKIEWDGKCEIRYVLTNGHIGLLRVDPEMGKLIAIAQDALRACEKIADNAYYIEEAQSVAQKVVDKYEEPN